MDYLIDDSDDLAAFLETVQFWRRELEFSATPEALEKIYQTIPTPLRENSALLSMRLILLTLMEADGSPYNKELELLSDSTRTMLGEDHDISLLCAEDKCLWLLYIESPRLIYMRQEMRHQHHLDLAGLFYQISRRIPAEMFYRRAFLFLDQTLRDNELETLSAGCLIAQCLLGRCIPAQRRFWQRPESFYEQMFSSLGQALLSDYPRVQNALRLAVDHPLVTAEKREALPVLRSLHLKDADVFGADQKPRNIRDFIFGAFNSETAARIHIFWKQILQNNPDAYALSLQNLWRGHAPLFFIGNVSESELLIYFSHHQRMMEHFFGPDDEYSIDAKECVRSIKKKMLEQTRTSDSSCDPF